MTVKKSHDIAIIGSGPGGYVAAIKAAQMGLSVALIERDLLGGCCLNTGCIPTKTLLFHAGLYQSVCRAKEFGISTGPVSFDYAQMKNRKDRVVAKIRSSLEGLLKTNQIVIYRGFAEFASQQELKVAGQDNLSIAAKKIIIATGSVPLDLNQFPCDHQRILDSTSVLELISLPKSICIIGGGYIGCEFASLFSQFGTKVTIVEAMPAVLSSLGPQIAEFMAKSLKSRGIAILTNTSVQSIVNKKSHASIALKDGTTIDADMALVAIGRKIVTDHLALNKAGLAVNDRGAIVTNSQMETAVNGIYAIGDVTGRFMLAHVASHQGIVAASNAAGREMHIEYNAVPSAVFTDPEIGTVGMTLESAREAGYDAAADMCPFLALGKAQASQETEGFGQIVSDRKTGQILGAQVIGHDAANLIAEMGLAIQNELTLESIMDTIHAHPTNAEIWSETAAIALGAPINFPPKGKR